MTNQPTRTLELTGPREETPAERELRRHKLLRLDRCLDLLENAMEKDCAVVDRRVAAVLAETTPLLAEGMAVPDAIEVVTNHISKNLSCSGNSHPGGGPPGAGALPIWDSVDTSPNGLYPRASEPNTVDGTRSGQCVTASPTTMGGPPAAPAF